MIDLLKLYNERPECFKDSKKFNSYLIDLYPLEKKSLINVLTTLLEQGIFSIMCKGEYVDNIAFCNHICDDYGYRLDIVQECSALFFDMYQKQIALELSKIEKLLNKIESHSKISILKYEISFLDLFSEIKGNDTSYFLQYNDEKRIIHKVFEAEEIKEKGKLNPYLMDLFSLCSIRLELERIVSKHMEERA